MIGMFLAGLAVGLILWLSWWFCDGMPEGWTGPG